MSKTFLVLLWTDKVVFSSHTGCIYCRLFHDVILYSKKTEESKIITRRFFFQNLRLSGLFFLLFFSYSENVVLSSESVPMSLLLCKAWWQKATEAKLISEALKNSSLVRLVLNSALRQEEVQVSYCNKKKNSGWQNLQETSHTRNLGGW